MVSSLRGRNVGVEKAFGQIFGKLSGDPLEIFGPGGVPMYQSHKPEAGVPPDGNPPLGRARLKSSRQPGRL